MIRSICFIIPEFVYRETGGAELQVSLIANELLRKGWKVEIVAIRGNPQEMGNKLINTELVRFIPYSKIRFFRSFEFFTVFMCLLRTRSGVYYQRTTSAHTGAVGLYCRLFSKRMVFAVAHDQDLITSFNTRNFREYNYRSRIKAFIRKKDHVLTDRLIQTGLKNSDAIVCQTRDQQAMLTPDMRAKSVLIRNSYAFTLPAEWKKENIILWVGNLRKFKRPELFLQLAREMQLRDWEFCIIGQIRDKEYEMVRQSHPDFRYAGPLPYQETLSWFSKARILINTSEGEGFSNTFIQGWLLKVYIMSLNVDPDHLLNGAHYGFCANNDLGLLKSTLAGVCDHYEKVDTVIAEAFEFAKSEFNLSKNIANLEAVLDAFGKN